MNSINKRGMSNQPFRLKLQSLLSCLGSSCCYWSLTLLLYLPAFPKLVGSSYFSSVSWLLLYLSCTLLSVEACMVLIIMQMSFLCRLQRGSQLCYPHWSFHCHRDKANPSLLTPEATKIGSRDSDWREEMNLSCTAEI